MNPFMMLKQGSWHSLTVSPVYQDNIKLLRLCMVALTMENLSQIVELCLSQMLNLIQRAQQRIELYMMWDITLNISNPIHQAT